MVAQRLFDELFSLPIADRLEVLDRLRESLQDEAAAAATSDEQRKILTARLDKFEQDESAGVSWAEVERHVQERLAVQ